MEAARLGAIPDNVTVTPWVDQVDVYPHASLLVCHGGAGTVLAGVTYGLPMVITPIAADQPDNARLMENAGAAIVLVAPDTEHYGRQSRRVERHENAHCSEPDGERNGRHASVEEAVRELEGLV